MHEIDTLFNLLLFIKSNCIHCTFFRLFLLLLRCIVHDLCYTLICIRFADCRLNSIIGNVIFSALCSIWPNKFHFITDIIIDCDVGWAHKLFIDIYDSIDPNIHTYTCKKRKNKVNERKGQKRDPHQLVLMC